MKTFLSTMLALLLVTGSAAHADRPDNVALVTAMSGTAEMDQAGKSVELTVGTELQEGASIRVISGTLSLVFLEGSFLELKAGEVILLGRTPGTSRVTDGSGTRGIEESSTVSVAQNGVAPGGSQEQLMKLAYIPGIRGDKVVVPVSPRLAISSDNPEFLWFDTDSTAEGGTKSYTIVVKDGEGGVLLQKTVQGRPFSLNATRFSELPALMKAAPEKHYSWTIAEPQTTEPLEAAFVIIDEEGLRAAREKQASMDALRAAGKVDEQSWHSLLALYFMDERERLFADAVPHLNALAGTPSSRAFALRNLILILGRFGNQVAVVSGILQRHLQQTSR